MLQHLEREANYTLTENMALTHLSAGSYCLDLFATIGALRRQPEDEITKRFDRAWAEDRDFAMKILFYARDIRGGLGERRVFRTLLRHLASHSPKSVAKNLWAVPEYGRYDDLCTLLDTQSKQSTLEYIKQKFQEDLRLLDAGDAVSLLGKWLPSINAHNADTIRYGGIIAKSLGLSKREYRKKLTALRAKIAIIENNLREKDYSFNYSTQPSKAMFKYRKAFIRNDMERYTAFLKDVEEGKAKINTGTLLPYEIIRQAFNGCNIKDNRNITAEERKSMDVTWKALPDFTRGENALVVVDGSGSMYGGGNPMPAEVALSLGIYFAERNEGIFKNCFITFSTNPRLVRLEGKDIFDMVRHAASFNEIANTNIQKVFELILHTAVNNNVPQKELPSTIYIISDMEFDFCAEDAGSTNFEYAKKLFEKHGYNLPDVVFWNVDSRNTQQPVTMHETGVALVSGASPRVFSMVSSGILSPMAYMLDIINSERYRKIMA